MRRILLIAAVGIFVLDAVGFWRRWSSIDPISLGLALAFGSFLI